MGQDWTFNAGEDGVMQKNSFPLLAKVGNIAISFNLVGSQIPFFIYIKKPVLL
jgi:hypothetical protein